MERQAEGFEALQAVLPSIYAGKTAVQPKLIGPDCHASPSNLLAFNQYAVERNVSMHALTYHEYLQGAMTGTPACISCLPRVSMHALAYHESACIPLPTTSQHARPCLPRVSMHTLTTPLPTTSISKAPIIAPLVHNGANHRYTCSQWCQSSRFEMWFSPQHLLPTYYLPVGGCKPRLHTPKAVTYHEQSHYCRFMIGHSLGRMGSGIKN